MPEPFFSEPSTRIRKGATVGLIVVGVVFLIVLLGAVDATVTHYVIPSLGNGSPNNANQNTNTVSPATSTLNINAQLAAQSSLKRFGSLNELKSFIDTHNVSASFARGVTGFSGRAPALPVTPMPQVEELGTTLGLGAKDLTSGTPDYSTTNVQVAGVDEADIVKSDGKYLYVVSKKKVLIIDAHPAADAHTVATIELDAEPQNLYLNGNSLVVYGQVENVAQKPYYNLIRPSSSYAYFKVFDVKDKANPKLARDLTFEGNATNSRMIGDYVYLVTSQPSYSVTDVYPLPMVLAGNSLMPVDPKVKGCNCPEMLYVDYPEAAYGFTNVTAINVVDPGRPLKAKTFLLGGTENLYVSEKNMYLVYTKYMNEIQISLDIFREVTLPGLDAKKQQRISEIQQASATLLSPEEKLMKISAILQQYVSELPQVEQQKLEQQMQERLKAKLLEVADKLQQTVIHRITLDGDKLEAQGSGEVPGRVLNQFSMDEQGGYLRLATTRDQSFFGLEDSAASSSSNVYVLDNGLKIVGRVEGLAKGEQIYAARFMQDRAYLVTFRQTDPLFVIDLRDPKNPAVLGQLKVPGFSSYLQPFDETTLIGFGKQATTEGRVKGLKLSLFDVSDVSNLKELATYEMGDAGSDSIALSDHKAFLFSGRKNLLAVPVTLREVAKDGSFGSKYTHGAMVFTVAKDGFTFRKRIDHSDAGADNSEVDYRFGYSLYDTSVKRSLYINDMLYTISNKYLKANSLADLAEIKTINLTSP